MMFKLKHRKRRQSAAAKLKKTQRHGDFSKSKGDQKRPGKLNTNRGPGIPYTIQHASYIYIYIVYT